MRSLFHRAVSGVLFLAIALASGLTACGGGGGGSAGAGGSTASPGGTAAVYPRFDPAGGDIPLQSDLRFAGSRDGTAQAGAASGALGAALDRLDGFSTSAAIDLPLSGSVDPASVVAGRSVWLIALDTSAGDPLSLDSVQGVAAAPSYDAQVLSLDGGTHNLIRVRPLLPLRPRSKYLLALSEDLRAADGTRLGRSTAYEALRGSGPLDAALQPLRSAVLRWEAWAAPVLAGASGGRLTPAQARDSLVLTQSFTTTDPLGRIMAMAAPRAAVAAQQIAQGVARGSAVATAQSLDAGGRLPSVRARALGLSAQSGLDFNELSSALAANVGRLYTGFIRLPYYLTAADAPGLGFGEYLNRPWRPDADLALALGAPLPADGDGSLNLSWRFPFAAATGTPSVPLQVTLPMNSWVPGYAGAANCGQIHAATGFPLVIYAHGITDSRSSVIGLAHALAARCIATVAIDFPLHGVAANNAYVNLLNTERSSRIAFAALYGADAPRERHFNIGGAIGAPAPMNFAAPGAQDGSGVHALNLLQLTVLRDQGLQGVVDLLNLNASLGSLDAAVRAFPGAVGLDLNRISLVGVSLGGILGSVATAVNQRAIAEDAALGLASPLRALRGLVASVAGTQGSQVLVRSPRFAPQANQILAGLGLAPGTSAYERYFQLAQASADAGDPVNHMALLAGLGVPVLLQQVNGDRVVPNAVPEAPLAGTEAMARLLGATALGLGNTALGRGLVRLQAGDHLSLLRPAPGAPQVTAEMQAQVLSFVLNGGVVSVGSVAPAEVQGP